MIDTSRLRVGKNILVNRLTTINGLIKHDWMNYSKDAFKIRCKKGQLGMQQHYAESLEIDKFIFLNVNHNFTMK